MDGRTQLLTGRVVDVSYEDQLSDAEAQARRLLAAVGLDEEAQALRSFAIERWRERAWPRCAG